MGRFPLIGKASCTYRLAFFKYKFKKENILNRFINVDEKSETVENLEIISWYQGKKYLQASR